MAVIYKTLNNNQLMLDLLIDLSDIIQTTSYYYCVGVFAFIGSVEIILNTRNDIDEYKKVPKNRTGLFKKAEKEYKKITAAWASVQYYMCK